MALLPRSAGFVHRAIPVTVQLARFEKVRLARSQDEKLTATLADGAQLTINFLPVQVNNSQTMRSCIKEWLTKCNTPYISWGFGLCKQVKNLRRWVTQ